MLRGDNDMGPPKLLWYTAGKQSEVHYDGDIHKEPSQWRSSSSFLGPRHSLSGAQDSQRKSAL